MRFDFAQPTAFDEVQIWNHNQPNLTDRGFRQARLFLSADGLNWTSDVLEIPRGKGSAVQPLSLAVKTDGKPMKSEILAADSNYGGSDVNNRATQELFHEECPPPLGCFEQSKSTELMARMQRATWYRRMGHGASIVSAATALTGLILVYLNRPQQIENPLPKAAGPRLHRPGHRS